MSLDNERPDVQAYYAIHGWPTMGLAAGVGPEEVWHVGPPKPENKQFESGAVRSKEADTERYDLISPVGMKRLAMTYAEGAAKYSDRNWEKGIPASDLLNHVVRHIYLYLSGDRTEDHLAHATWGLMATMHFEELKPELLDGLPPKKSTT